MLEIPARIWKKIEGYTKPQDKPFRTNHENVLCWKALRKSDKKPVVIKLFEWEIVEYSTDELRAAEILKKIDHKHLVRVLDVVEDEEIGIYYVMEHWGDDLRNTIKVKPDPNIAIDIVRQVLEGLAELHRHKLSHRDIKPENIFLNPKPLRGSGQGQVKIGDYGLVKSQRFITQLTTIAGTRDYMAPEVATGNYDYRCDIYSTGVVLRELLTGEQPPFSGDAPDEIVSKAMAKEPKDRFQTAEEFINALTHRRGTEVAETSPSPFPSHVGEGLGEGFGELRPVATGVKSPIFQKLEIQRYPPRPEMHGQDNPGVTIETLKPQLDSLLKQGDYESALKAGTEYVKAVEKRFGRQNSRTADAIDILAEIFLKLKNYREADSRYSESLELDKIIYGQHSRQYLTGLHHLAQERLEAGDYPRAKDYYKEALSFAVKGYNEDAIIRNNLSGICYSLKEYNQAINLYQEAIAINEKVAGKVSEAVAINLYNMAITYEALGQAGTAQPFYKQAKETLSKLPPDKLTISDKDKEQIIGK